MLHRGLRLCTLSSPPAKPTISRKGLGWKMFSAECRNTNWAKRTSRIFSLGTGHLPNAKVTQTDIKLTQKRMQLTPHPCQLHLTLSICTSSDAYVPTHKIQHSNGRETKKHLRRDAWLLLFMNEGDSRSVDKMN